VLGHVVNLGTLQGIGLEAQYVLTEKPRRFSHKHTQLELSRRENERMEKSCLEELGSIQLRWCSVDHILAAAITCVMCGRIYWRSVIVWCHHWATGARIQPTMCACGLKTWLRWGLGRRPNINWHLWKVDCI